MLLLSVARLVRAGALLRHGHGVSATALAATVLLLFKIAKTKFQIDAASLLVLALLLCPQALAAAAGFSVFAFGAMIVATASLPPAKGCGARNLGADLVPLASGRRRVRSAPLGLRVPSKRKQAPHRHDLSTGLAFALPLFLLFHLALVLFWGVFPLPFLVKSNAIRWHRMSKIGISHPHLLRPWPLRSSGSHAEEGSWTRSICSF